MHSSTSSSNPRSANASIATLLVLLVLLAAIAELGTRFVAIGASKILNRVQSEHAAALLIRPAASPGEPRSLLVVGNSLLLFGVDMDALQRQVGPQWRLHRLIIESTSISDWYFGMRRLIAEGSRPDAILLMVGDNHFAQSQTRGDYFARYLMNPSDLPAVMESTQIHPTVASGYLLARFSDFFALRSELRKQVVLRTLPGMEQVLKMLVPPEAPMSDERFAGKIAQLNQHAAELAEFSKSNSISLAVCIAPNGVNRPELFLKPTLEAYTKQGIPVFVPLPSVQTTADMYVDGYHLNERGRSLLTTRLASMVQSIK